MSLGELPEQHYKTNNRFGITILMLAMISCFFSTSCSVTTEGPRITEPTQLLPDSVYIPLLANIQLMQVWNNSTDTLDLDSVKKDLFRTFKVSEKQFLDSHRYYQSDFEGQRVRLDSIKVLIETEKRRVQEFRRNNEQTN
tara:strand:- start:13 stop:432 length:420 start_codon:yes stop_codon:yes gene_type:complete